MDEFTTGCILFIQWTPLDAAPFCRIYSLYVDGIHRGFKQRKPFCRPPCDEDYNDHERWIWLGFCQEFLGGIRAR